MSMLDMSQIPHEVLLARGQYSTVRAAHEDGKKALQLLCAKLSAGSAQILRSMQPDNNAVPCDVSGLIEGCRATLDAMEIAVTEINDLAAQRSELRVMAWQTRLDTK